MDYLDKGYVQLVDSMGTDLSFVNAARASFEKRSTEWNETDERLLAFCIREGHWSIFRHGVIALEIKAPLMVARQHFKYTVASSFREDQLGWNESSRRYVTSEPEFYVPIEWRGAPSNKKQGSDGVTTSGIGSTATHGLRSVIDEGMDCYKWALANGICAEQARLFLPAYALYISYQWTVSVGSLIHFLKERLDSHAQWEMQQLAQCVRETAREKFPHTIKALELG